MPGKFRRAADLGPARYADRTCPRCGGPLVFGESYASVHCISWACPGAWFAYASDFYAGDQRLASPRRAWPERPWSPDLVRNPRERLVVQLHVNAEEARNWEIDERVAARALERERADRAKRQRRLSGMVI